MAEDKAKDKPTRGLTKQKSKETWRLSEVMPLKLEDIDTADEDLQSRLPDALLSRDKASDKQREADHIKALVKELENLRDTYEDSRKHHLDPIVVFHEPNRNNKFKIVSGFHRAKAYLAFNDKQKFDNERKRIIRCRIFTGSEDEAFLYSAAQDIKPVRSKQQFNKANAAWKLIHDNSLIIQGMTHGKLAEKTGISKSLVRTMREVRKAVEADHVPHYSNWKAQLIMYKSGKGLAKLKSEEDYRNNLIGSVASDIYNRTFLDACGRDKALFEEVLRETLKRINKDAGDLRLNNEYPHSEPVNREDEEDDGW